MEKRGFLVWDFDGTWTDADKEVEPAVTALVRYLAKHFDLGLEWFFSNVFEPIKKSVTGDQEHLGICKHPDEAIITAPLSSSVFELYTSIFAEVFQNLVSGDGINGQRNRFINRLHDLRYSELDVRGSMSNSDLAKTLLRTFLDRRPMDVRTVFRPGLEGCLQFALDRGIEMAVITNSPEAVVRAKVGTRQKLSELVRSMEKNGKRVIGSACKDRIYPMWDGNVRFHGDLCFNGMPDRIRITQDGLTRPIYMKRENYAHVLAGLGFLSSPRRFAVGDCAENDLLLPHLLRSEVALFDHSNVPPHERRWASRVDGARVVRSFEEVSEMLERV